MKYLIIILPTIAVLGFILLFFSIIIFIGIYWYQRKRGDILFLFAESGKDPHPSAPVNYGGIYIVLFYLIFKFMKHL
jgi:hypothetical protein